MFVFSGEFPPSNLKLTATRHVSYVTMSTTQTRATSSMTPQRRCSTRTQIFRCPSILAFASLLQLASGFQFDIPPNRIRVL